VNRRIGDRFDEQNIEGINKMTAKKKFVSKFRLTVQSAMVIKMLKLILSQNIHLVPVDFTTNLLVQLVT